MYNLNTFIFLFLFLFLGLCICRDASNNSNGGLSITVNPESNIELIVKGQVTANSNVNGIYADLNSNANLEIKVESGATLNSCGNGRYDIYGDVSEGATVDFSGTGYACDQDRVVFGGPGTGNVVRPTCQACP